MKDMGIRTGSKAWAVPVIVTPDTVYVHTDITEIKNTDNNSASELYQYHEVQYDVQEYIELIGSENEHLKEQLKLAQSDLTDTQLALCEVYEMLE